MFDFHALLTAEGLISLVSLTAMEIVLGIDNIIFIAILSRRLPRGAAGSVAGLGIGLALVMRLGAADDALLDHGPDAPLFTVLGKRASRGAT